MNQFKKQKDKSEKLRGIYFQLGFIVSGGLALLAFEWTFPTQLDDLGGEIVYEEEWDAPVDPFDIIEEEVEKEVEKQEETKSKEIEIVPDEHKEVKKEEKKEVKKKPLTKKKKKVKKVVKQKIPTIVEVMPEFKGGIEKMFEYLGKNIKYPNRARNAGIQGKVYVSFVVNKKGEIKDVKVLRGVNELIDAEAIRVVKGMPNWIPGIQSGNPVSVRYNLPISFTLR